MKMSKRRPGDGCASAIMTPRAQGNVAFEACLTPAQSLKQLFLLGSRFGLGGFFLLAGSKRGSGHGNGQLPF